MALIIYIDSIPIGVLSICTVFFRVYQYYYYFLSIINVLYHGTQILLLNGYGMGLGTHLFCIDFYRACKFSAGLRAAGHRSISGLPELTGLPEHLQLSAAAWPSTS